MSVAKAQSHPSDDEEGEVSTPDEGISGNKSSGSKEATPSNELEGDDPDYVKRKEKNRLAQQAYRLRQQKQKERLEETIVRQQNILDVVMNQVRSWSEAYKAAMQENQRLRALLAHSGITAPPASTHYAPTQPIADLERMRMGGALDVRDSSFGRPEPENAQSGHVSYGNLSVGKAPLLSVSEVEDSGDGAGGGRRLAGSYRQRADKAAFDPYDRHGQSAAHDDAAGTSSRTAADRATRNSRRSSLSPVAYRDGTVAHTLPSFTGAAPYPSISRQHYGPPETISLYQCESFF